ncbi:MAG TPA: ABC transporter permease [Polyangiaceae bacterium]|nr:ABC transporter permease [Polyangiaceae bacterium]
MTPVPHPLSELVKARLREFMREPGYVFWVFGFPLLLAVGLGIAFRDRAPELPRIAVVAEADPARTQALFASKELSAERLPRAEAERALGRTKFDLLVDPAPDGGVTLRFDPSQERSRLARAVTEDVLERAAGRTNRVAVRDRTVAEKGSRYVDFLLPGLIGLNLMGSSMWGIGFNLVLARKRRLLRRYAVTPMRHSHFLLAYFFSRSIFLALELALLVGFGKFVFGTTIQGNPLDVFVLGAVGAASFAGISLIVGARLDNTEVANGWMNFVMLPMWILSGSFFTYERFPAWLRVPIRLLPLTAVNDALRAVYNDGASLFGVGFELAVLAAWGIVGFGVALKTFRWQ